MAPIIKLISLPKKKVRTRIYFFLKTEKRDQLNSKTRIYGRINPLNLEKNEKKY